VRVVVISNTNQTWFAALAAQTESEQQKCGIMRKTAVVGSAIIMGLLLMSCMKKEVKPPEPEAACIEGV
jgi:hypothetical protein